MEIPMFVPGKTAKEPGHFETRTIGPKDHLTGQQALKLWQEQQALATKYNSDMAVAKATEENAIAQAKIAKSAQDKADADIRIQATETEARNVVEGDMDPTQLTKRAKDYDAKIAAIDAYSMKNYGRHFDLAKAQDDYKQADKVRQTLDYMNSLTGVAGQGGNFAQLERLSNSITRTDYPALNNLEAWKKIQTGDPAISNFRGLAVEVSDQVAKILQGGGTGSGTTDAKLRQASELFNTGFSKQAISGMITTLREALNNRKLGMIQNNRYLMKWYGPNSALVKSQQPQNTQPTATNPGGLPGLD